MIHQYTNIYIPRLAYCLVTIVMLTLAGCSKKETEHNHLAHEEQETQYTCPMHPQVKQASLGKCPVCGMDLVLADGSPTPSSIMLNDTQLKLANITTRSVGRKAIGQKHVVNATLAVDENKTTVINTRSTGRIEKLYHKETGRFIKKGDPIYQLYSESLLVLQREYLVALEQQAQMGKDNERYASFVAAAAKKLLLYGVSENQLRQIAASRKVNDRLTIFAPASGVLTEIQVAEGQYVQEGQAIGTLEDLSTLWVEAELYPHESSFVKQGDEVAVLVNGTPDPVEASVIFLSPEFRANSQITRMRAALSNEQGIYRPGMQVQVLIHSAARTGIVVPVDAVIRTGKGTHLYVRTDTNTFQPRVVTTGTENFNEVEIVKGVTEGEVIAVTGAYLLYSELVLKHGADPMTHHTH